MAAPRKYPDELRERATRMAVEARRDPATRPGALARIGKQLGINPETLRNWVTQAEIDGGVRPGTTTDETASAFVRRRPNLAVHREFGPSSSAASSTSSATACWTSPAMPSSHRWVSSCGCRCATWLVHLSGS